MHIPPYHHKRSWQVFLIGFFFGSLTAYLIFMFMYGKLYGDTLTNLTELEEEVQDLTRQNEILLEDKEQLQLEQKLTIQSIDVFFTNQKQFRFDRLTRYQLTSQIKEELSHIIGKDVKSIAENNEFIINIIEKTNFTIDDLSYQFTVKKLIMTEDIELHLEASFAT